MEPGIQTALALAAATIVVAAAVGWRVQRGLGAFFLAIGALLASCVVIGSTLLGFKIEWEGGPWLGLAVGCLIVGVLARLVSDRIVRGHSGRFVAELRH